MSLLDRLTAKIDPRQNGCWLWFASVNNKGYGTIRPETALRTVPPVLAHRALYELLIGPVLDGLELDHLCRTPSCVNPTHLEPVTHQENMRRANQKRSTCKRGHLLVDDNVYTSARGQRSCRQCALARAINQRRRDAGQIPWPLPTKATDKATV